MTDGERLVRVETQLEGIADQHTAFAKVMDERHAALDIRNRGVDERLTGISRSVSDTAATIRAMKRNGNGNGSRGALAWGSMLVMGGTGIGSTVAFIVVNWPKG